MSSSSGEPASLGAGTLRSGNLRLLIVDPLCEERGHLLDDDLFWCKHLASCVTELGIATSIASIDIIRKTLGAKAERIRFIPRPNSVRPAYRFRLWMLVCRLKVQGYSDVMFQSFEESSVLLFCLFRPLTRVHLIVTNNLALDRLNRMNIIQRSILRWALQRAKTLFVHSAFEMNLLVREFGVDRKVVFIKPYHRISALCKSGSFAQRERPYVLFVGPPLPSKPIEPLITLIEDDTTGKLNYIITHGEAISKAKKKRIKENPNVTILEGYLPAERYFSLIGGAAWVLLTHTAEYEGRMSGVLADSIALGTPVISSKIAPATEIFESYGNMGIIKNYSDSQWTRTILDTDPFMVRERCQGAFTACHAAASPQRIINIVAAAIGR